ncbi:hypothetical protein P8452_47447 [Trifolium repens]|nr:hypothetical protein P8452_47447 [Trifolium repens]
MAGYVWLFLASLGFSLFVSVMFLDGCITRTCVAPLEKLKLEYIVRGEKRNIFELIQSIATSQVLRGFWKGNLLNILRTAPFKSVNFSAYDAYRKNYLDSLGMRKLPISRDGYKLLLPMILGKFIRSNLDEMS